MTREQQKRIRELKKLLPQIIQSEVKKYKFKKKDFMVWHQTKELFFDLMISICERDGHCYCTSVERVKPMWIDDLLWDILGMPENKKEPASLRAIGAFAVYGSQIYDDKTQLLTWEKEELEQCVIKYMAHFYESVQSCGIKTFYDHMDASVYQLDLRKALSMVYEKKYEEAIEEMKTQGRGCMCNGDLWVNDAIIDYCNKNSHAGDIL